MTTDDYVTRLREAALASVPPSTLDLDTVLRSSRRKASLWRAGTGAGLCLAVAAGGVGVANALPLLPGLVDAATGVVGALAVSDAASPPPADNDYDIPAPGVTAQTQVSSSTTTWDGDSVLLGLGLRPEWLPEDQSLWVEYTIPGVGGPEPDDGVLRVLVSGPEDAPMSLEALSSGESTATVLAASDRGLTVVEGPGGQRLVVGLAAGMGRLVEDDVAHLVLTDTTPDGRGGEVSAVEIPVMDLGERREAFLYAAVLEEQLPGVRAGVAYEVGGLGALVQTCDVSGDTCVVAYHPESGTVSAGVAPAEDPVVSGLVVDLMLRGSSAGADVGLERCLALRGVAGFDANYSDLGGSARDGVPADVWSACHVDLVEAARALATGHGLIPPQG